MKIALYAGSPYFDSKQVFCSKQIYLTASPEEDQAISCYYFAFFPFDFGQVLLFYIIMVAVLARKLIGLRYSRITHSYFMVWQLRKKKLA